MFETLYSVIHIDKGTLMMSMTTTELVKLIINGNQSEEI